MQMSVLQGVGDFDAKRWVSSQSSLRELITEGVTCADSVSLNHFCLGETGTGISRDEYIANVAKDIENKIPQVFNLDQIRKGFGPEIPPTTVVLLQELERFNKLIVRMAKSLAELQRVSKNTAAAAHSNQGKSVRLHLPQAGTQTLAVFPGLGWGSWNEQ